MKTYADLIQALFAKAVEMRKWQDYCPDPTEPDDGPIRSKVEQEFDVLLAACRFHPWYWKHLELYLLDSALPPVECVPELPPIPTVVRELPPIPNALPIIPAREEEFPW